MKRASSAQNRKLAGARLKELRLRAGLTQHDLAVRLRLPYYTFVAQVEGGYARVPTRKMEQWAVHLGEDPRRFARELLWFYEPELHRLLYGSSRTRTGKTKAPD